MDILNQIIQGLNKEEIRFFKLFAHRQQGNADRKDISLLDFMRKQTEGKGEEKIFQKLYGDGDKNAFYRLKNRLVDDLNKSLMLQHVQDEELLQIFHLLMVVRIYTTKGNNQLSFYFLKKAEQRARKIENYELLDIVYGEFIKLSHELLVINPEIYIQLRKENNETLFNLRQMDDLLAAVSYRLKITQNFGDHQNSLIQILESTIGRFMDSDTILHSGKFRFKLYSLVCQLLLQRKDYKSLEAYLLQTWKEFNDKQMFTKNNHDTKLQMLTYMVNSLFKNGKTQESLEFANILHDSMEEYNRLYYDKYEIFYYNALVNNYSIADVPKAIELLLEMQEQKNLHKVPFYELFIYLNLATSYFDLKQFNQAIKNLNKLFLIDSYKKADPSLKFKIAVAELIIRFELGDQDFWNYRKDQLLKEFSVQMKQEIHIKEQLLIQLIEQAEILSGGFQNRQLRPEIENYIQKWNSGDQEDEIIKYTNWLSEKIKAR
jgi:tetratricopeptide (TPR) repeat protein